MVHGALLAHLEDAAVLHQFINKSTFIIEIVNVVVFELVEECELLDIIHDFGFMITNHGIGLVKVFIT